MEDFVNIETAKEGQLQLVNLQGQTLQQIHCKAGKRVYHIWHAAGLQASVRARAYAGNHNLIKGEQAAQSLMASGSGCHALGRGGRCASAQTHFSPASISLNFFAKK